MSQDTSQPARERAIRLTEAELDKVIKSAVAETFVKLGVDASNPIEMQKDFQHLRDWRTTTDLIKRKSILTLAGIVVAGLTALVWVAVTGRN